jgi:hypothetical protein
MLEHIILAIALQAGTFLVLRDWWAGAAVAAAWAISREITQAEYRWIEHFGSGLRANMPWWGGFDPKVWSYTDPWFDWIVPLVTVVVIALVATQRGRRAL